MRNNFLKYAAEIPNKSFPLERSLTGRTHKKTRLIYARAWFLVGYYFEKN